jgi:hypothetical protein
MSDYGSLLDRVREAEAVASRLERALGQEPGDLALQLDALSARSFAGKLQEQFLAEAAEQNIDICSYRIVPEYSNDYSVAGITATLQKFQETFSLIFSSLRLGPRKTARIPDDMAEMSALSIAYTYSGSLGVVLTTSGEQSLFGDLFDSAVRAMDDLAEIHSQDDVRLAANKYGKAAVTKFYEWSLNNYERSYSLDIKWHNVKGIQRGRFLARSDFVRIMDNIGRTSDKSRKVISVLGIFVGGDIMTRKFHFVDDHDNDYRGTLSGEFQAESLELGKRYIARIAVESTTRYATDEEDRRYTLMLLENDPYA